MLFRPQQQAQLGWLLVDLLLALHLMALVFVCLYFVLVFAFVLVVSPCVVYCGLVLGPEQCVCCVVVTSRGMFVTDNK